ncbi:MAG: type II toxin-antitoxin system HicB family antitoxin [Chitinispirillia bacterium]|nr:type II toxin-antitoxin system HicB family antitoxin [Chitinispirillia bacterium]MCL2269421.1 type II toxin-antitoxin system HicB family antitoxin [Chitinispirillia bacterium]
MKYVYPAIFMHDGESVLVSVPDLPGLHTYGSTMADAIYMAQDAIEMWLWDAENSGEAIPPASDQTDIAGMCKSRGQTVSMVAADTDEYRRQNDTRSVRKTLTIPAWLNHQAEKANAPFSQILQDGLKKHLHIA